MKCPECGHNHPAKYGLTCGKCDYRFTFNPKEGRRTIGLTDGKFLACLRKISRNGTVWYTENQLYGEFCRARFSRRDRIHLTILGVVFVLIGLGMILFAREAGPALMAVLFLVAFFGAGLFVLVVIHFPRWRISPAEFHSLLEQWKGDGKPVELLIEEPSLHEPPPEWEEPDLYDYGVERILIVERDILVDLFVKNGVHAEQRMLVIAESGYPEYLLPLARRLLDERPDLPVFLLHDATPEGVEMQERIWNHGPSRGLWGTAAPSCQSHRSGSSEQTARGGQFPLEGHPLVDLGMFPGDFQKLRRVATFDRGNRERTLPVDALLLPFLVTGIAAATAKGVAFRALLEEQRQNALAFGTDGGGDFG